MIVPPACSQRQTEFVEVLPRWNIPQPPRIRLETADVLASRCLSAVGGVMEKKEE